MKKSLVVAADISTSKLAKLIRQGMRTYYENFFLLESESMTAEFDIQKYFFARSVHNYAVSLLCKLATENGYFPMLEYPSIRFLPKNKPKTRLSSQRRIDVVWFDFRQNLKYAFEVDRSVNRNSLHKLIKSGADNRFIVSIRSRSGTEKDGRKFYLMKGKYSSIIRVNAGPRATKTITDENYRWRDRMNYLRDITRSESTKSSREKAVAMMIKDGVLVPEPGVDYTSYSSNTGRKSTLAETKEMIRKWKESKRKDTKKTVLKRGIDSVKEWRKLR